VVITARGFGWRWNGRRAWAVRGLDLEVGAGERVLLLGPSGAGKSTLLAAVAGLLDGSEQGTGEQEGELLVDGEPARAARARALEATTGRARTGLLLQDPQAQTVLARCGDDVAFGLENHSVPRELVWPRVDRALREVGLADDGVDRARSTARLSGGERQRLALAGVLALSPGVLLLDEPTAMLDPDGARRLRDVVGARLAATGAGCLVVEHRVALWLDLVDRVVVLAPGAGVLADGDPARVLADHGPRLAAAGVWVPGRPPATAQPAPAAAPSDPPGPDVPGPDVLLALEGVAAGRRGAAPVLSGVDAVVRAGRAVAVRGPNGAGKSTLALVLAGLARPVAGRVVAGGALAAGAGPAPWRWPPRQLVARIGSVFQDPRHQFVAATVADELAVGPRRLGVPPEQVAERVDELLERLRLAHLARANPFTLSGGEQRRLSVGTALASRPRLLVLDEPTFGQDARTWAELVALLRGALASGAALVAATHDDDLAAALADEVWLVGGGRVVVRDAGRAGTPG
jgi:energy-coupling factor transport system ATP-binding protein